MNFLLDTNVLSEVWKDEPDQKVKAWFYVANWFLPVPVIAEIQSGASASPRAAHRLELNRKLDDILHRFGGAVIDWDAETARIWGQLRHSPEVRRRPQALWDSLIDAMAVRTGYAIATRNADDFRHGLTFDPWQS